MIPARRQAAWKVHRHLARSRNAPRIGRKTNPSGPTATRRRRARLSGIEMFRMALAVLPYSRRTGLWAISAKVRLTRTNPGLADLDHRVRLDRDALAPAHPGGDKGLDQEPVVRLDGIGRPGVLVTAEHPHLGRPPAARLDRRRRVGVHRAVDDRHVAHQLEDRHDLLDRAGREFRRLNRLGEGTHHGGRQLAQGDLPDVPDDVLGQGDVDLTARAPDRVPCQEDGHVPGYRQLPPDLGRSTVIRIAGDAVRLSPTITNVVIAASGA